MIAPIRAELRKLTLPVVVPVAALIMLLAVFMGVMEQEWASIEVRVAADKAAGLGPQVTCAPAGSSECDHLEILQQAADRRFVAGIRASAALIGSQQTLPGAASFVSGLMMSTPGLAVVFLLAAASVAGEWQRRTAVTLFLAERRLFRVLAAKAIALAGVTFGILIAAWLAVYLYGSTIGRRLYPLGNYVGEHEASPARAAQRLALAVVVIAVFASLAVGVGAILRHRVGTLLAGIFVIGALNLGSTLPVVEQLTPLGVLADVAAFSHLEAAWDYVMATPPPLLLRPGGPPPADPPLWPRLLLVIGELSIVGGWMVYWLRRHDLVE